MTTMPENMGYCLLSAERAIHINIFPKLTKEMFDRVEFVKYPEGDFFDLICNKTTKHVPNQGH